MFDGQMLATVMWQEGMDPRRLSYRAAIPAPLFFAKFSGAVGFSPAEIDGICKALRITPDLRRAIFGEVQYE